MTVSWPTSAPSSTVEPDPGSKPWSVFYSPPQNIQIARTDLYCCWTANLICETNAIICVDVCVWLVERKSREPIKYSREQKCAKTIEFTGSLNQSEILNVDLFLICLFVYIKPHTCLNTKITKMRNPRGGAIRSIPRVTISSFTLRPSNPIPRLIQNSVLNVTLILRHSR